MDKYLNKVLIVDGSYCLHRSLSTPGLQELSNSKGEKSGGVFGFLRILQSEVKKFSGYFPIITWDKGLSPARTKIYPDYKANRKRLTADELIALGYEDGKDPYLEEYHRQRSDLIEILNSLGIPSILIPGWEGDDLMYLVSRMTDDGIVLSDDKDLIQLVSPTCRVRRAMRDETISWEDSDPSYRHPHYTIVKSMCGDPSDNIPKVASGLGWKGADQIAQILESLCDCSTDDYDCWKSCLETYLESHDKGSISTKIKKLIDNWDQFVVNYKLTNLRLVTAPDYFDTMIKDMIKGVAGKSNLMKSYALLGRYEMSTIYPDQIVFSLAASAAQLFKE